MTKKMKIKVLLPALSSKLETWNHNWHMGLSNDPFPYGYNWAEDDYTSIDYVKGRTIKNKYLKKIYEYLLLPFKTWNSDVVWTHYDNDAYIMAALKKIPILNKFLPKQISCFIWLADKSKNYSKFKMGLIRWLIKGIDQIIYLAPTEASFFSGKMNIPEDRHTFVPFGINIESYSRGKEESIDSIATPYILSLGNDVHRDIDMLDQVARRLKGKAKVVFASQNKAFIERLKNNDNIELVSANLKQVRWLYRNCLFVILPLVNNEHASGCTTILEAGANGKPVVATNCPGLDAYIDQGGSGYLVEQNNPVELYSKSIYLLEHEEERTRMGKRAEEFVNNGSFSTEIWAKTHLELSKKILKRHQDYKALDFGV
ncbi:glycosyltransferase family 4 protein [Gorillibacterium sp. sgz5001074]|uniref:glycosyltransferase family 4 protein n=1 Tax=Gorillibacterium sp. sgz5001074 TaxID=3446695 RepID=UPI003F67DA04